MTISNENAIIVSRGEGNQTQSGKCGKENEMEEMNTFELETFLKMILEILKGCESLEEAQGKIKDLLNR